MRGLSSELSNIYEFGSPFLSAKNKALCIICQIEYMTNCSNNEVLRTYDIKLQLTENTYRLAQSVSFLIGFEKFEDYVKDCLMTNLNMLANGGAGPIDESINWQHFKELNIIRPEKRKEKEM
jgi:hypothetical protein